MRPKQWIKNAFVFAGLLFSGEFLNLTKQADAWIIFVGFCLASGATYLFNDVIDAETDRANPRTASRPIARGDLKKGIAIAAATAVALSGIGLVALINWQAVLAVAGFLLLQTAYSLRLKHILFLDVMAIATGFVLRAYAGLVGIDVAISGWLLLSAGVLALFIALGKRRSEVVVMGGENRSQRPVLESYSISLLDELIAVVTSSIVVIYALYSVLGARSELMLLSLSMVIYGIFRVLFIIHHNSALTEDPAMAALTDRPLQACIGLWVISTGLISVLST